MLSVVVVVVAVLVKVVVVGLVDQLFLVLAAFAAAGVAAERATRIPESALAAATALRDKALADDTGWKVVESLTTEIGPRLAGSDADAKAVAWAQAKFKALGFDKGWIEPVTFPKWVRRSERAAVLGEHAQPLTVTALGGSPAGTVEAEIVRFADLAALEAAPAESLAATDVSVDASIGGETPEIIDDGATVSRTSVTPDGALAERDSGVHSGQTSGT